MQSDTPTTAQLRAHLLAVGLDEDERRLAAMLPAYSSLLSGARRLAVLDLGETEPAMTFRHGRIQEPGA